MVQDDESKSTIKEKFTTLLLWSDVIIFFALGGVIGTFAARTEWWIAGMGLALFGFALWMIARYQLGKSFSATAQARELITTGLYQYFRHPIYLFGGVAHLGLFIALQNLWVLAIWSTYFLLIQGKRVKREDQVLHDAFGDAFVNLRQRNWL